MEKTLLVLFTVWATCVQTSPEKFAAWVAIMKLLEIAYRKIMEGWNS